jgi:taurine dioxygenase
MAIEIKPLTATLGAEITGVDMANPDEGTLAELRRAWLDHKVLVLRDQHISTEEHIAFGRAFGELEIHPFASGKEGFPEIVAIHSKADQLYAASMWHSDVTWREQPSMGSILRATIVPPVGGDTCFADACAAYERLDDAWKERIEGLFAIHDFSMTFGMHMSDEERAEQHKKFPPARHPVVRTHPETGKRAIYTNRAFVSHIDGVSKQESEKILTRLERAIFDPSVQCRICWEVDTFVMWDNRCTQHHATDDFFPLERRVERVTVVGDRPF